MGKRGEATKMGWLWDKKKTKGGEVKSPIINDARAVERAGTRKWKNEK